MKLKKYFLLTIISLSMLILCGCSQIINDFLFSDAPFSPTTSSTITLNVTNFSTDDLKTYHIIKWSEINNASYYKVMGGYDSSCSSVIFDDTTDTCVFDGVNNGLMYYKVYAYNTNGTEIASSSDSYESSSFTVTYTYSSSDDHPHHFSWQGADNISYYKSQVSTNYGDTWSTGNEYSTPGVLWSFSGYPYSALIKVGFYYDYNYIWSEEFTITLD